MRHTESIRVSKQREKKIVALKIITKKKTIASVAKELVTCCLEYPIEIVIAPCGGRIGAT